MRGILGPPLLSAASFAPAGSRSRASKDAIMPLLSAAWQVQEGFGVWGLGFGVWGLWFGF